MAPNALPIRPLGKQGLRAAAQGFGCMSLSKGMYHDADNLGPEEDRIAVIRKALSSGVTLLNTADLYGPYDNHVLIGKIQLPAAQLLQRCSLSACKCMLTCVIYVDLGHAST